MTAGRDYVTENGVRREATDAEQADIIARREHSAREMQAMAEMVSAKESAKAKLAALGLTEAEVNAIIGGV